MLKKSLFIFFILFINSAYCAGMHTPAKKAAASMIFSPEERIMRFNKFRTLIINSFNNADLNAFKTNLTNYFNTIVYPMQIKNTKFYASLFYCVLREICNADPYFSSDETMQTITAFIKNSNNQYFALEFFIYSGSKDGTDHNAEDREDLLTPEIIHQRYSYNHETGPKRTPVTTIRVFLDIDDHRNLKMYSSEFSENTYTKIIPSIKFAHPSVENRSESFIYPLIDQYDLRLPDFETIRSNLNAFYNHIPKKFTEPFRIHTCEKFYHALFFSILNLLRNNYADTEFYTKNGRGDILLYASLNHVIIEFKHKGKASEALKQIKDRDYMAGKMAKQGFSPLMVGINIRSNKEEITVDQIKYEEYQNFMSPMKKLGS